MVDTQPPPTPVPPDPPEDAGPDVGSEAWETVQETRNKRKDFGAGIGFLTGENIRRFLFEMNVQANVNDETDLSKYNLHSIHKEFVAKLLASPTLPTKPPKP